MSHDPRDARLLETDRDVEQLAGALASEPLIAVDTEADSFHSYFAKVCLVQVSTRDADFIIDPLSARNLEPFREILARPTIVCVLHGSDYDIRILDRDHDLHIGGLFDTMIAARFLGYEAFGLASLLERHFGLKVPKAAQRADWSRRPLTADLLGYAATDTHHLPELHDILRGELEARGRLAWAEEEFRLLEDVRHQERAIDPLAFLKIKGARGLGKRELGVLKEIHAWRERQAQKLDRAPFRVLGNAAMVEFARRKPGNIEELRAVPGMPRGLSSGLGGELLQRVQTVLDLPEEELPSRRRPAKGPRSIPDPAIPALKKVRDAIAVEVGLEPGLVAPNALLDSFCQVRPSSTGDLVDLPGMRRWQVDLLGERMLQALRSR